MPHPNSLANLTSPGRPKGCLNKITTDIREAALLAAEGHPGGLKGFFERMLQEEPAAMLAFLARCLPREVNVELSVSLASLLEQSARVPLARVEEIRAIPATEVRVIENGAEHPT